VAPQDDYSGNAVAPDNEYSGNAVAPDDEYSGNAVADSEQVILLNNLIRVWIQFVLGMSSISFFERGFFTQNLCLFNLFLRITVEHLSESVSSKIKYSPVLTTRKIIYNPLKAKSDRKTLKPDLWNQTATTIQYPVKASGDLKKTTAILLPCTSGSCLPMAFDQ
jgi:hypothetical protein